MLIFPETQKKNWVYNGLLLMMFSSTFSRALGSTATWLAKQGSFSFLSFTIEPLAIGMASTFCGMTFMRKFGSSAKIVRNLYYTHGITLLCRVALTIILLMLGTKLIQASLTFGYLVLALTFGGWLVGCAGIEWQRRIADRRTLNGVA